jgi:hypothetical protein
MGLALAVVGFSGLSASADLLVPGTKWIRHSVVVDNLDDFPELALFTYVSPLDHSGLIEAGKPLDIGNGNPMNSVLVVGIPKDALEMLGGKPQKTWFGEQPRRVSPAETKLPEGVVISTGEVPHIRSAAQTDPTEHIVTHLKIKLEPEDTPGVKGAARLVLEQASEERLDGAGKSVKPSGPQPPERTEAAEQPPQAKSAGSSIWLWAGLPLVALLAIGFLVTRKRWLTHP